MPRTLYDDSGNPVEVPTDDEAKEALEAQEQKVVEAQGGFENLRTELGITEGESITEAITKLKDSGDGNWKKMRETNTNLKMAVEKAGKKVDDNGNIIDESNLSPADIDKKIADGVSVATFKNEKDKIVAKYPAEQQEVFKKYLDQLLKGQDKSISNLVQASTDAERLAFPNAAPIVNKDVRVGLPTTEVKKGKLNSDQKDLGKKLGLTNEDLEGKKKGDK